MILLLFFFFSNYIINSIFADGLIIKYSKYLFFNNNFKYFNYNKNFFFLGFIHIFKIQKWFILNLFLYNSVTLNFQIQNNQNNLNIELIFNKKKNLNYKNLLK